MGRVKQRKRNSVVRERKSVVAIGCEGKNKTETNYFRNFSSRECKIKFSTGNRTDPVGMAEDLVKYIKDEDISTEYGDKIYLLIDIDVNQNKQELINKAKIICDQHNIELIVSNPTFEYWYILHFGITNKSYQNSKQAKTELRKILGDYTESMDVFEIIKDKTQSAIANAKQVEKLQQDTGCVLYSEQCNPYTAVYKVVEELIGRNKVK